jgi:putative two-component system response regulator
MIKTSRITRVLSRADANPSRGRLSALHNLLPPQPLSGRIDTETVPIKVLVVDDEALNRRLLRRYLRRANMDSVEAVDGMDALEKMRSLRGELDVVLLDLLMPGMRGDAVLEAMRKEPELSRLPVLVCTNLASLEAQETVLELGASDFLNKPVRPRELVARIRNLARLKRGLEELDDAEQVILTLARTVEAKDEDTEGHCERLSLLSVELGRHLGLTDHDLRALDRGGVLHDIGKVGIPDAILFKPGPLDAREWEVMRTHPTIGDQMVAPLRSLQGVRQIIRHHHERWNGSGYPDGLAGDDIPLTARVLQVVDAYDAMRSERPYKAPWDHHKTVEILREEESRGLWDPTLLSEAIQFIELFPIPASLRW